MGPSPIQATNTTGDPYDFILNPQKPSKPKIPVLAAGNSVMQRVIFAVIGLFVLIILAVIALNVLTAGSKEKTQGFLTVAQDQTELIRVATNGTQHASSLTVQSLAQNVQASITSDNTALVTYMKHNGLKTTPTVLGLTQSKATDASLTAAQQNDTYDTTFKTIIQTELTHYMAALQKVYKANPGPKGKALLSKQYSAASLLKTASEQP